MNDRVRLKAADSAPPPIPSEVIVELLRVLRETVHDAHALRQTVTTGGPSGRATARAVETFEGAARALDLAELLARACRYHHGGGR